MSKNKKFVEEIDKPRNYVAKHMNTFNRATVEVDRKAEAKKLGHANNKHKGRQDW